MNFIGEGGARQQRVEHGLELITGSCSATRDAQRGAGGVKPAIQVNVKVENTA